MGFSVTIFKDGAAGQAVSKVMERQSSPEGHLELRDKIPCWCVAAITQSPWNSPGSSVSVFYSVHQSGLLDPRVL